MVAVGGRIGAWALVPLAMLHAWLDHWTLAGIVALAALVLAYAAVQVRRETHNERQVLLGLVALVGCTAGAIQYNGLMSVMWAYPLMLVGYFVAPRGPAHLLMVAHVVATSVSIGFVLGPAVGARVAVTMLVTLVLLNVVINVVGELQQTLQQQANTDPLTGVFNRRYFESVLAVPPAPPQQDALLLIDIDHFKAVNDRHGHAAGDAVLRALADTVRRRTRRDDLLFRTGGEEFALLLRNVDERQATQIAESMRVALETARLLPGERITVSIGISLRPHGAPVDDWIKRGDVALYEAKRAGRNRVMKAAA